MDKLIELPPKDGTSLISVEYWKEIAVKFYLESDASRQCQVVEIWRYKRQKRSQHEYLVAVLQCQNNEERYVRIERNVRNVDEYGVPILTENQISETGHGKQLSVVSEGGFLRMDISCGTWASWIAPVEGDVPEDPQPPSKSDQNTEMGASRISTSISKVDHAHDIVTYWEPSFAKACSDSQIETFKLNTPIPLAYLAILAKVVHEKESLYNLFKYQCYWYADMIARVIAKQDGKTTPTSSSSASCDRQRCYDPASGKYKMIPVLVVRPRVVEAIEITYKAECERLAKLLEASLANDTNKDAQIKKLQEELERLRQQNAGVHQTHPHSL